MERQILGSILVFASVVFVQSNSGPSELLSRHHRAVNDPRLTSAELKEVLSVHNYVRTLEGSSDMQTLRWNNFLASMAEEWAAHCLWDHGHKTNSRNGLGYEYVGQNLYYIYGGSSINLTSATMSWYNEKPFYTYNTMACQSGQMCGHYTQIVWAETYEIGCAYIRCPTLSKTAATNAFYFVCNYGPGGNIVGQKPYQKGSGCTKCSTGQFWCTQELCNRTCSSSSGRNCDCSPPCKHGASVSQSTCSCKCAAGWTGVDCSKLCKNYDSKCDPSPGKSGWPPSWCNHAKYGEGIRQSCPLMCNMCKYDSKAVEFVESASTTNRLCVLMLMAMIHSHWIVFALFDMLSNKH